MPAHVSHPEDLALHGARVLGFASASRIAKRYGLDVDTVDEVLRDCEALGWVRHTSFAGSSGWSVTDAGRIENERRQAIELDRAAARETVTRVHADFVPLNRRFGTACTSWQFRPTRADPMAFNDHTDWRWDERVLRTLTSLDRALAQLCDRLTAYLRRFDGYADRYSSALARVDAGQRRGSMLPNATPATPCGSSFTKTCSPPSECHEERTPEPAAIRRHRCREPRGRVTVMSDGRM